MDPGLAFAFAADDGERLPAREIRAGTPRARAEARRTEQLRRARTDCGALVEYAIPHEKTGRRIRNAPFHWEWHRILDREPFAVIIAAVEHGKTQQIGVGRPLWMIGNDPESRGALISNTSSQAEKLLGAISTHIVENPRIREVFPHLVPSSRQADPWHSTQITVRRETIAKDPTIQALGVGGPVVGSRLDWAILDDVLDFENTRTAEQLTKLLDWFDSTLWTRLTAGAVCWVIGTPWHPSDLLHLLEQRPDWFCARYAAVHNPKASPADWRPRWPESFSVARLLTKQRNMTPHNFGRKFLCTVRHDTTARFQQAWIDRCVANGRGWHLLKHAPKTPGGRSLPCFTGVDLGVGQDEQHDLTVLFTIAIDARGRRIVVDIQSGRWTAPEIIRRIGDVQQRYESIVTVESNGAQRFLLQWPGAQRLNIVPFTTTAGNKYDEAYGVESIAVEMRNGQWVIPSGPSGAELAPEVQAWINDLLFYQPAGHTGDRLMGSWFARETARSALTGISVTMDTTSR